MYTVVHHCCRCRVIPSYCRIASKQIFRYNFHGIDLLNVGLVHLIYLFPVLYMMAKGLVFLLMEVVEFQEVGSDIKIWEMK